jgi:SAM-dependent methyltransferase
MRRLSLLRALQYECFDGLALKGVILDYGGGSAINYRDRLATWIDADSGAAYKSVNIDPAVAPDYLLVEGQPLPISNDSLDGVISLNTFEHIYDTDTVLTEVHRVMRRGAGLHFTVPFLMRVHGHPSDFSRHTASFWQRKLVEKGFGDPVVTGLSWGPFSNRVAIGGAIGPLKRFRATIALWLDWLYFAAKGILGKELLLDQDHPMCATSLGYYVSAFKN